MATELSMTPTAALPTKVAQNADESYRTASLPSVAPRPELEVPRTERLQTDTAQIAAEQELSAKIEQQDALIARKAAAQAIVKEEEDKAPQLEEQRSERDKEVRAAKDRVVTATRKRDEKQYELEKIAKENELREAEKLEAIKKKAEEIKIAEVEVKAAECDLEHKLSELKKVEEDIAESKAKIDALKIEIAGYDKQIDILNGEIQTLTDQILAFELLAQEEKVAKERKAELQEEYELRIAKSKENSSGFVSDQQARTQAFLNASDEIGFKSPEALKEAIRNGSVTPAMINAMMADPGLGQEYRKILEQRASQETLA